MARRKKWLAEMGADMTRFRTDYPEWQQQFDLRATLEQMLVQYASSRWA